MESTKNTVPPSTPTSFDSCGEAVENLETVETETLNEGPISIETDASPFVDCGTVEKKEHFTCNVCHKTFSTKGTMARHIIIHTGQKPIKCNFCEKAFTQQHHLERHMRIHTEEKVKNKQSFS